ncbi:MAG: hypothetical protein WC055_00770 [Melioribacteraceae bacterium]
MLVKIGKYYTYWGVFQLSDLLQHLGFSEDACYKIGKYLSNTKLNNFCEWVYSKRKRKVKIHIDEYDVWSLDSTLSLIILPCLIKIREDKHGAPYVDDADVPDELKSTYVTQKENIWDTDENWFKRWDYVLEQMIWSFERICDADDEDQFHTGNIDIQWKECKDNPNLSEMISGPDDTHVFNREGYLEHQTKIQNGLRLFGKYFRSLWT